MPPAVNHGSVHDNAFENGLISSRTATAKTASVKVPDIWDPLLLECTLPVTRPMAQKYSNRLASIFTLRGKSKSVGFRCPAGYSPRQLWT
jgi:hypothetical protein